MNSLGANKESMTQIKPIDISVLIPVFNGIKYIQRGLDAICNQSLKSIEIIVVDDGSTDGSSAFLDEYAQKDSRITIIHQQNAGAGRARNVAMDHAHGEFFYFFDIDDTVEPTMLEVACSTIRKYQAKLAVFGFRVTDGMATEDVVVPEKQLLSQAAIAKHYVSDILSVRHGSGFLWNKLYRGDVIRRHHIQFNHFKVQEDELFNIAYMKCIDSVVLMPHVFYTYYISNSGNSRSRFLPNMHEIIITVHQTFVELRHTLQIDDPRFHEFLCHRTFSALMLWVTFHLYHPDCPWTDKERKAVVRTVTDSPVWKVVNHPVGLESSLYAAAMTAGNVRLLGLYVQCFRYLRILKKAILHA